MGKSFLDVGSGSGLFSLAARRLGARVHSFDFDPQSVACTSELKRRYFPNDLGWTVQQGSVLNLEYVKSLPPFDIVYSWGVLHHTGAMWQALDNVTMPLSAGGILGLALYNDQGIWSRWWCQVKRVYCSGTVGKVTMISLFVPYFILVGLLYDMLKGTNPVRRYVEYKSQRGMSIMTDWIDWLGGYPFEVAKPGDVVRLYRGKGFDLRILTTCGGSCGNNQYVFERKRR
jgi:2-polyprenyl-6-hydroxyphenyl methylase/3-demethylubiquinone-9 3-methyltransferase